MVLSELDFKGQSIFTVQDSSSSRLLALGLPCRFVRNDFALGGEKWGLRHAQAVATKITFYALLVIFVLTVEPD